MSKHNTFSTIQNAQREYLLVAVAIIQEAKRALLIFQVAMHYNVSKMTLSDWLQGSHDKVSYGHSKQKLTTEEEASLESWVLQLQA